MSSLIYLVHPRYRCARCYGFRFACCLCYPSIVNIASKLTAESLYAVAINYKTCVSHIVNLSSSYGKSWERDAGEVSRYSRMSTVRDEQNQALTGRIITIFNI
jgi:hypothetical protein